MSTADGTRSPKVLFVVICQPIWLKQMFLLRNIASTTEISCLTFVLYCRTIVLLKTHNRTLSAERRFTSISSQSFCGIFAHTVVPLFIPTADASSVYGSGKLRDLRSTCTYVTNFVLGFFYSTCGILCSFTVRYDGYKNTTFLFPFSRWGCRRHSR